MNVDDEFEIIISKIESILANKSALSPTAINEIVEMFKKIKQKYNYKV